jgi:beta-N-acetylhexosaminidase
VLALAAAACSGARAPTPEAAVADQSMAGQDVSCVPAPLEERAGRVLVVGLPDVTSPDDPLIDEVLEAQVGGVLLTHANVTSAAQVLRLVGAIRYRARSPLFVAADEEPGRVRTFEALTGFEPSARRLAAEETVDAVQQVARTSGSTMARLGVTVAMAPVADLDAGPWNGIIGDRSFSDDPVEAAAYALAYARGLQQAGVTPVVKHFPGHGRTNEDDHSVLPRVRTPLPVMRATDVRPFEMAVSAGAPVVMVGHVAYDALDAYTPASLSPASYRLLRELGFQGAAITDSIGMGAVNLRWDFHVAAVKAVQAGADGVLATDGWQAKRMRDALVAAVQAGTLDEQRLDEAASRMMALSGRDSHVLTCRTTTLPTLH